MSRVLIRFVATAALATGISVASQAEDAPSNFDYCLVCHGAGAAGNEAIGAPNLTVLSRDYLRAQLLAFQKGWRGARADDHAGQSMVAAARTLQTPEAIDAAVEFVAAFPEQPSSSTLQASDPAAGAPLYASCASCHGAQGEGSAVLNAPRLRGQDDWYLLKQMNDYRAGHRGAEEGDRQGTIMRAASALIDSDRAALALVAHIGTLGDVSDTTVADPRQSDSAGSGASEAPTSDSSRR